MCRILLVYFQAHLNNLVQRTKIVMIEVNRAIGESICMGAEDISVVSDKAATFHQGNKVNYSRVIHK